MNEPLSKARGDLLEDVVAALHDFPGVEIRKRVFLPVVDSASGRKREIDVLLAQHVAGYPVRIAIECKNEKERVGTQRIDEFLGKLDDVGIPSCHAVFVSPLGYTAPGLERASKAGLKTLQLEGLTEDRLGAALNDALQSFTYLVATISQYDRFEDVADDELPQGHERLPPGSGLGLVAVNTFVWRKWVTGALPGSLGRHTLLVRLPPEFRFSADEPIFRRGLLIVTVVVSAHVARLPGTARHFSLRDASTSALEKIRVEASFELPEGALDLETIETEKELNRYLESLRGRHVLSGTIRVPRLIAGNVFWPPSAEALEQIRRLREQGEEITFAKVEGRDLSRAWEVFSASR